MIAFKDLELKQEIQTTLDLLGFTHPTEIQSKAIPLLINSDCIDFHGQAQTGTGKTLAFGLPLLQKINSADKNVQALIVAPTRELVGQICDSLKAIASPMGITITPVYGGMSMDQQVSALRRGTNIVVGTPGRLNDHLRRGTLSIRSLKTLVLDEADIMLDMGFKEEVDEILSFAPTNRQIWLFSATVKDGIQDIMRKHMKQTVSVATDKKQVAAGKTKQYFAVIPMRNRLQALCRFIDSASEFYGFVFCQTKILTAEVADKLTARGYRVAALHGDMSQAQRNSVIKKFKQREYTILCATDVAARGIDVANLTHVINYSLPDDHESYVHRIGRTGRAGKEGIAITFLNKTEVRLLPILKRKFNVNIEPTDIPSIKDIVAARIVQVGEYVQELALAEPNKFDTQLMAQINNLSENALRQVVTRMLHEKFLNAISEDEVSFVPAQQIETDRPSQELFINLGTDDGITNTDVAAFLTSSGCIQENDIYKIRVIKRRTFIEVPPAIVTKLLSTLRGRKLGTHHRPRLNVVRQQQ